MAGGVKLEGDEEGLITDINVTPLVDIMLVLLIAFMLTASFIIAPQSIPVDLPKAKSGDPTGLATLAVAIDKDGSIYLNGASADEESIISFVKSEMAAGHDLQAVISAHKLARHGVVVRIIDIVRRLGVEKFAIAVDGN